MLEEVVIIGPFEEVLGLRTVMSREDVKEEEENILRCLSDYLALVHLSPSCLFFFFFLCSLAIILSISGLI